MQNINLTPIIQALIGLLAALITWKVIPWIRERTTKEQRGNMRALIQTLVYAAEQLYGANKGEEKLDYVIARLEAAGYKVDKSEIEAAVYKAFNEFREVKAQEALTMDETGLVNLNIASWSLEQLKSFCELNGVPTDGCLTREDYMDAIEQNARREDEPPDSGGID